MVAKKVELIRPQSRFIELKQKFRAYVAGYRAGKTWAGCTSLCKSACEYPGVDLGYYAPTYPLIRGIFYPTIERVAHDWGMTVDIKVGDKEVFLYSGRNLRAMVTCRSMEDPSKLIGYQHGSALVDEIDTLTATKADSAWTNIIARNSLVFDGLNRIDVCTTPEGFSFTYNKFVKAVRENPDLVHLYGLIQASTYENEANLPADYIPSLQATYPENLIQAYLHGQFVNLKQGTVYHDFDRKLNGSTEKVRKADILYIGMDFNVGRMAAVVNVKREGMPHAVDEIVNAYDTPEMIKMIKERYWSYIDGQYRKTHQIRIYPDSSGGSRKTVEASTTDIQLLKDAGFIVSAPAANPPVKDRVNSMNAMICNSQGERRFRVNIDKCPTLAENLEQQAYNDKGAPDKSGNMDHTNDAQGYFIHREYPLRRPVTNLNIGVAM